MSTGQTRVVVLIVVLFFLEMVVHPEVKAWLQNSINSMNASLFTIGSGQTSLTQAAINYNSQVNQIPGVQQGVATIATKTTGIPGPYGYPSQINPITATVVKSTSGRPGPQGYPTQASGISSWLCSTFGIGCPTKK